ncbi:MAG: dicarboxylate/amino acid:cation symporter [Rhodobacteraceae bacterium]|nr:dicarboxylate/amino acid:cation symporter [Paracoccaceae bacterium]
MTPPLTDSPIDLSRQRFKLRSWISARLWAQVMAGMVAGLGLGLILGPEAGLIAPSQTEALGAWLALPGRIFLALIAMVLVPLIFSSIIGGLAGAQSGQELRAVGLRLAGIILLGTLAAAGIGVALAQWLRPGDGITGFAGSGPVPPAPPPAAEGPAPGPVAAAPDALLQILPANPTAAIAQGDMLAVVVLALLVGISVTQIDRDRAEPFLRLMDALLSISMNIVKWAMFLAPFAVFGLMAQLVMRLGLETLAGLSAYVGTVLLGLAVLQVLYLALAWAGARISPRRMYEVAGGNLLLAFSTSSSSAVMPMTIQSARRLGVPERVAGLVVPLGATMNMAGTALYQAVAILFLAQLAGIELAPGQIALIVLTLVGSSIGAPGTPGVSIAILVSVAASVGIPAEGMVIILGVDRLLDMARTSVNVTGDLVAAALLRNAGETDTVTGKGETA